MYATTSDTLLLFFFTFSFDLVVYSQNMFDMLLLSYVDQGWAKHQCCLTCLQNVTESQ